MITDYSDMSISESFSALLCWKQCIPRCVYVVYSYYYVTSESMFSMLVPRKEAAKDDVERRADVDGVGEERP
jgi:hypothetical protein